MERVPRFSATRYFNGMSRLDRYPCRTRFLTVAPRCRPRSYVLCGATVMERVVTLSLRHATSARNAPLVRISCDFLPSLPKSAFCQFDAPKSTGRRRLGHTQGAENPGNVSKRVLGSRNEFHSNRVCRVSESIARLYATLRISSHNQVPLLPITLAPRLQLGGEYLNCRGGVDSRFSIC
jgi:hypothetical protein